MEDSAQAHFSQDGRINHWLRSNTLHFSRKQFDSVWCKRGGGTAWRISPLFTFVRLLSAILLGTKSWVWPDVCVMWPTPKEVFLSYSSDWLVVRAWHLAEPQEESEARVDLCKQVRPYSPSMNCLNFCVLLKINDWKLLMVVDDHGAKKIVTQRAPVNWVLLFYFHNCFQCRAHNYVLIKVMFGLLPPVLNNLSPGEMWCFNQ